MEGKNPKQRPRDVKGSGMKSQPMSKEFTIWRVFPLHSAFVIGKAMMDSLNKFPQPGSQRQMPGREDWKGK